MCDNTFENMRSRDIHIQRCEWSHGCKMTQSKSRIKKVNYFTCVQHFSCRWYGLPEVDLNWYPRICNPYWCDIEIQRYEWTLGKKWPKVNRRLKLVNYFTCMQHFPCRWYRPPEVHLNGYPRISNPYCRDIIIWRCNWLLKIVNYFTCMRHFFCR